MHKTIVIVEGENDRIFFHEVAKLMCSVNIKEIATYSEIRRFAMDIASGYQKTLSIIEGGGSNIAASTVIITRYYWYTDTQVSVGVIGDMDTGSVYKKLSDYLSKYLKTPCKVHVFEPLVVPCDSEKKIEIKLKKGKTIPIWTCGIPDSLEIQIARTLKKQHPKLNKSLNEDETIEAATRLLGITREKVIRDSVSFLQNEKWLVKVISEIKRNTENLAISTT